ncbi:hypothetical protein ISCGN_023661 [Ixodes scapularis]
MGRLNIQQRLQVLRLKKEGRTHAHIKRKLRCSLGTVRRVLKNYRLQKNVNDQPRKPAPSKTVDQDMQIIAAIVDEPFLTLKELKRELGLTLSVSTIAKRLKNLGLISLNNSSNRALTDCMKDARLSFARAHASWTADRWRSVVFTNESTICCKWDPNKSSWKAVHIWNNPLYIRQLRASGYTTINVLAVITSDGLGPLIRADDTITPEGYVDILNQILLPYLLNGPFPNRGFLLQHDPSPTYTSDEVLDCIEAHGVCELRWPPKSEDLNPVQRIWSAMKERICRHRLEEPSADKLWGVVKKHWDLLTKHKKIVTKLYSSVPDRLQDLIKIRGGAF